MVASMRILRCELLRRFCFLCSWCLSSYFQLDQKLHDSVVFFFLPPRGQKHPSLWSHEDVVPKKCVWNVSLKLLSYLRSLFHLSCCCKSSTWALEAARCKRVFFLSSDGHVIIWSQEHVIWKSLLGHMCPQKTPPFVGNRCSDQGKISETWSSWKEISSTFSL